MPLHFEPRLSEIHIDQEAIDTAFEELVADMELSEADKSTLSKKAASIEVLIKAPTRIAKIAADIAEHFRSKVEPSKFKAQVVAYDKATCVAYKEELDKHLGPDASTIVMSKSRGDTSSWKHWTPGTTSLSWSMRRTAPRRVTTAGRCARHCPTRYCSD